MANTWDTLVKNLIQKKKITATTSRGVTYVTPLSFVLGDNYFQYDIVLYSHTSGLIEGTTVVYMLEARTDLPEYDTFDLLDWNIVQNHTWNIDRALGMLEKYDIFPGDKIILNGEDKDLNNPHGNIITSDLLITEFANIRYRQLGTGVSSIQLSSGINYFLLEMPIEFDAQSFGLVDNSTFNAQSLISILFDNIPTAFELYIKFLVKGNPLVRTTYPEITDYFTIKYLFTDFDVIELTDFTAFDYLGYPTVKPAFTNDGDFVFHKFYKTTLIPKVRYEALAVNTIPDIF